MPEYYSFSYLQCWLHHILSFLILPRPHTCNHTHKSSALPVSSLTWCRQKAWIHPRPSPHPSSFFSHAFHTHTHTHMLKHTHTQPANMYYVHPCVFEWVMCQMWSVLLRGGRTKNVMKEALPAVKRIQCKVEVRIQLALWAPWNDDNTDG